jgi:hypothetical protein
LAESTKLEPGPAYPREELFCGVQPGDVSAESDPELPPFVGHRQPAELVEVPNECILSPCGRIVTMAERLALGRGAARIQPQALARVQGVHRPDEV